MLYFYNALSFIVLKNYLNNILVSPYDEYKIANVTNDKIFFFGGNIYIFFS